MKKLGLRNPAAVAAVLTSPRGQEIIKKQQEKTEKAISTGFTVLKFGLLAGVLAIVYFKFIKGFTKIKEDTRYTPSNINVTQAKARAEAIYTALLGFGANYTAVENALIGLNHNGFIKVYNEFGERRSSTLSKMNLVEWLQDQFAESDMVKLRFIIKGFF